jgi:hypothetical protein
MAVVVDYKWCVVFEVHHLQSTTNARENPRRMRDLRLGTGLVARLPSDYARATWAGGGASPAPG